jgi:hypothetical protein
MTRHAWPGDWRVKGTLMQQQSTRSNFGTPHSRLVFQEALNLHRAGFWVTVCAPPRRGVAESGKLPVQELSKARI